MRLSFKHPVRPLLTGFLALLPLAATVLIVVWSAQLFAEYVGPLSLIGRALTFVGLSVTESKLLGYIVGLLAVLVLVYLFGIIVEAGLQRGLSRLVQNVVQRIPVVRTIYDVAQKLVGLFAQREGEQLQSMSPVWVYFGGKKAEGSTAALAFLSTPKPVHINGHGYLGVLIPTAPVPVGGGLLYVPPEWVEPADMGMEGVTSIYVSMGVTSEQYLGPRDGKAAAPDGQK
jgi:uncharacterized membrane protein